MNKDVKKQIKEKKAKIAELEKELQLLKRQNSGLFIGEKYYEYYDDYEIRYEFLGYLIEEEAQKWKEETELSDEPDLAWAQYHEVDITEYELRMAIDSVHKAIDLLERVRNPFYNKVDHIKKELVDVVNIWNRILKNTGTAF